MLTTAAASTATASAPASAGPVIRGSVARYAIGPIRVVTHVPIDIAAGALHWPIASGGRHAIIDDRGHLLVGIDFTDGCAHVVAIPIGASETIVTTHT